MDLASNITISGIVIVDPYVDNFWLNVLATVSYIMSTSFSMFLIWFASVEFTGNFSEFRPVTQQLVSFCVFHVSQYLSISKLPLEKCFFTYFLGKFCRDLTANH